jgi:hypothetical protein
LDTNEEGERVYSDFGTADLYERIDSEVKLQDGPDTVALCIGLSMDKSHCTRLSNVQAWPASATPLNLKTKILSTRNGSTLVGYCPMLPMSERSFAPFLHAAGVTFKTNQRGTLKLSKKKLEQDFLEYLQQPIIDLEDLPPILLQYGSNPLNVFRTRLYLIIYISKRAKNCILCSFLMTP